jgi:uncharacterized small protein (DUF1192 family)
MKPLLLLIAGVAVLVGAAVGYQKFVADTPDQIAAKLNLALIDQIDQAWIDHKQGPRAGGALDPEQFRPLRSNLLAVNVTEAGDDVKALHRRFVAFVDRAPTLLTKLKSGPSHDGPDHPAVQQRAAEDWTMEVRNIGIQLENELAALQEEIKKLRAAYTRKSKTR